MTYMFHDNMSHHFHQICFLQRSVWYYSGEYEYETALIVTLEGTSHSHKVAQKMSIASTWRMRQNTVEIENDMLKKRLIFLQVSMQHPVRLVTYRDVNFYWSLSVKTGKTYLPHYR